MKILWLIKTHGDTKRVFLEMFDGHFQQCHGVLEIVSTVALYQSQDVWQILSTQNRKTVISV